MRKQESSINLVLSLAKQTREHKVSWCGGFSIDKSIIEFCQSKGIITYRDARNIMSLQSKFRKLEKEFTTTIEKQLTHKKFYNWRLFYSKGDPVDSPAFIPESVAEDGRFISHEEEVMKILNVNEDLQAKNKAIKNTLDTFIIKTEFTYDWIHQLFIKGTLESEIEEFLKKKEGKKSQARMNRMLVRNLIKPELTNSVEEVGEPPILSTSERQTLQFLLWKFENMNETEKRLKELLLEGKNENPKINGICVCFEESEAISNAYGKTSPAGFHYNEIKSSLKSLSEKNRKLILKNEREELKISVPLIKKADLEHRFKHEPEFKKYIAVYLDVRVLDIGEKYTSFPNDHFALLRHTPPKTRLTEQEVKFFDILYNEVSYNPKKSNMVRRKKIEFLKQLDVDRSFYKNNHFPRLANIVEKTYVKKGLNLGILEKFDIETNREGEEIYIFTINAKEKIPVFQS